MSTLNSNPIARAVRYALIAGTAAAVAMPTVYAAEDEESGERITVTGSRIKRSDAETAQPVYVIDRDAIVASGAIRLGDLIQESPSIAGAATNPQVNNGGGTGAATVSLRGLDDERTLLLLNGRRVMTNDVNSIPTNIVERVEIQKDGGSSVYGTDAVAGVVNIITVKDFEGVEFNLQNGISAEEDGEEFALDITTGASGEKGNVVFGLSYNQTKQISSADRPHSKDPVGLFYGQEIVFGSSRIPTGRFVIPISGTGYDFTGQPNCTANAAGDVAIRRIPGATGTDPQNDYECFIGGGPGNHTFNFQADNVNQTPQQRINLYVQGNYEIADDVQFYAESIYNNTSANFQIAPEPFDGRPSQANIPVAADNIYNPFGVEILDVRKRLVETGNRVEAFDAHRFQTNLGFDGVFETSDRIYDWNVGYTYGQFRRKSEAQGEIFSSGLRDALGSSFVDADGVARCGTVGNVIGGCTPINFFANELPADQVAALSLLAPMRHNHRDTELEVFSASISGGFTDLLGGEAGFAFGFESRREQVRDVPDFLEIAGLTTGNSSAPVFGNVGVDEFFLELALPFTENVEVSFGTRISDYSSFGDTNNSKLGVTYRPTDELMIRGTFSQVFRAPTIDELFSGSFDSADSFDDPCNGLTVANQACQNVPLDGSFQQSDTQLNRLGGSNPALQPEEGENTTFGVVWSPSFIEGFSTTIDWWRIELEETIGTVGTQNRLDLCFNNGLFCDSFTRDASGEIFSLTDLTENVGFTEAEGVDLNFRYSTDVGFGQLRANLDMSYVTEYDNTAIAGDPRTTTSGAGYFIESSAGGDGHFARWRSKLDLSLSDGDWEAFYGLRYIGGVTEDPGDFGDPADPTNGANFVATREIGSVTYHDIAGRYTATDNLTFTIGVDNLANKFAPKIYSGFNGSTDVRTYDVVGRFYYSRVTLRF